MSSSTTIDNLDKPSGGLRVFVALITMTALTALILWILNVILGWLFPPAGLILAGLGISAIIFSNVLLDMFMVQVGQAQGLISLDPISKKRFVYGPGWHFRFPWEHIEERDNISLELRTELREGQTWPTTTDQMVAKVMFQWKPELDGLRKFRNLEDSTVNNGLFGASEELFSSIFAILTADEARSNQSAISSIVFNSLKDGTKKTPSSLADSLRISQNKEKQVKSHVTDIIETFMNKYKDLEKDYGITVTQVTLSDVDFSEDVQKARSARAQHESLQKLYYELAGGEAAYHSMSEEQKRKVRAEARSVSGIAEEKQWNFGNI